MKRSGLSRLAGRAANPFDKDADARRLRSGSAPACGAVCSALLFFLGDARELLPKACDQLLHRDRPFLAVHQRVASPTICC